MNMAPQELSLEQLKARMTEEQRRDMAEIVQNEVKRRERMKQQKVSGARPKEKSQVSSSGLGKGLGSDAMGEVYGEIHDKIKNLRMQKIDEKLAQVKNLERNATRAVPRSSGGRRPPVAVMFSKNALLVSGIVALALLKMASASGIFNALLPQGNSATAEAAAVPSAIDAPVQHPLPTASTEAAAPVAAADAPFNRVPGTWTPAEKQLLTELDARRVELEKRRQALDQREEDIKNQGQALAERLAELKTLSTRMSQARKERDNQYEARMEQLASVYGSMAPNEAAPLVNKLDEETALALLKRMPGKRMGQILSLMDPERAVALTRTLSDKSKLEDVPAKPE
jgi:flagellar motility protein MotE (MotC chaperone)